jgi:hypothetical protein
MAMGEVPLMASPLSNTSEYPDHVQVPAFRMRQVFVNVSPGLKLVPSGIVTSLTNCPWSQTGVADASGVFVEGGRVGSESAVFVGCGGGRVGVLNEAGVGVWFNCACTVNAACVKMALGSSVCGALEGRLQDERTRVSRMLKTNNLEVNLDMIFSSKR